MAVLLAIGASGARAQDALTMPFACSVRDGRVVLTPSGEQTYAIAGARQQQLFIACHPQNPSVCRTFPVHSFSIACGRTPVKWVDVAAAASDQQAGRVFVDNGQLNMAVGRARLGPSRGCEEDEPRPPRWRPGSRARQEHECGDGRPGGRDRNLVVLPAGYAPLGLAEAYLVPAPKMVSRDELPPRPNERLAAQKAEPVPPAAPRTAAKPPPPAAPTTAAMPPPAAAVERSGDERAKVDSYLWRAPEPQSRTESGKPAAAAVAATAPAAEPAESSLAREHEPARPSFGSQSIQTLGAESGARVSGVEHWPRPTIVAPADDAADSRSATHMAAIGLVAGLCVLSLFAWLGLRRRRPARPMSSGHLRRVEPGRAVVDVRQWKLMCETLYHTAGAHLEHIEAHLLALDAAPPLRRVLRREAQIAMERVRAAVAKEPGNGEEWRRLKHRLERIVHDLARLQEIAEGALASLAGRYQARDLPRDKGEAYAALGVNPDVSESILKKLVGALRASWHPDQARDDADRRQREERIKEINIAWDLITGKRQEA